MGGGRPWDRQKAEIDAYNTFLSAHHSRASDRGFSERGYVLVNHFPVIEADYSGTIAKPDFTLYNGDNLLLVEIKQGNNINSRHIEQMENCDSVMIERAEEHLSKSDITARTGFDGEVFSIEPMIVYDDMDEVYVDKCRNDWEDCRDMLEKLENLCPIHAQERGGDLRKIAGDFESDDLDLLLSRGISLPKTPRTTVTITDGLEVESIAVTVVNNWGQRAVSSNVEVNITMVRQEFDHREIRPGDVRRAFSLLVDLRVCHEVGSETIEFRPEDMDSILNIESIMKQVETPEREGPVQSGLEDFE